MLLVWISYLFCVSMYNPRTAKTSHTMHRVVSLLVYSVPYRGDNSMNVPPLFNVFFPIWWGATGLEVESEYLDMYNPVSHPLRAVGSHDIAQSEIECSSMCVLSLALVYFTAMAEYFKDFVPMLITLYPPPILGQRGRKWLSLMAPHNLWTSRRKAYVQSWADNGWKSAISHWSDPYQS